MLSWEAYSQLKNLGDCALSYRSTGVQSGVVLSHRAVGYAELTEGISSCRSAHRESFGGFASLAGARDEARGAGLMRWDIFRGNLRIERHDPGVEDQVNPIA
jgi:hypothetical protein